jgi:hypothetical protein
MTPDLTALGLRAVKCKRWRLMPGMLALLGTRLVQMDEGSISDMAEGENPIYPWFWQGPAIPDLSDPATIGCLLALVRGAWGETAHMVRLQTHDSDGAGGMKRACWWALATGLTSEPLLLDDGRYIAAPTEAEALVVALEAAP